MVLRCTDCKTTNVKIYSQTFKNGEVHALGVCGDCFKRKYVDRRLLRHAVGDMPTLRSARGKDADQAGGIIMRFFGLDDPPPEKQTVKARIKWAKKLERAKVKPVEGRKAKARKKAKLLKSQENPAVREMKAILKKHGPLMPAKTYPAR